jgi:hypothetical protein
MMAFMANQRAMPTAPAPPPPPPVPAGTLLTDSWHPPDSPEGDIEEPTKLSPDDLKYLREQSKGDVVLDRYGNPRFIGAAPDLKIDPTVGRARPSYEPSGDPVVQEGGSITLPTRRIEPFPGRRPTSPKRKNI